MNSSSVAKQQPGDARSSVEGSAQSFHCAVSADLIRRAMIVRSDEETRFYLRGVNVSAHPDGGAYLVATNGVMLVCFHDSKAVVSGSGIIMPNDGLLKAMEPDRSSDPREKLVFANPSRIFVARRAAEDVLALLESPTSDVLAAQYRDASIDGKFPDWRRTFRQPKLDGWVPKLDARHLRRMARALCADRRAPWLRLIPTGDTSADPVWAIGDLKEGVGIIMGLRGAEREFALPAWVGECWTPDRGPSPASTAGPAAGTDQAREEP